MTLTLPAAEGQYPSGRQRIWIDPTGISLHAKGTVKDNSCLTGRLTLLSMEATRIRATIDIGLPITVLLTPAEYQELQPSIGENMAIEISDEAVRIL